MLRWVFLFESTSMIDAKPDPKPQPSKARLVGLVGALCASVLIYCVPNFEGDVKVAAPDPVGITTACHGHTGADVQLGRRYTDAECQKLLVQDLISHAEGVKRCVDITALTQGQTAAAVSFTFNVGVGAFCKSTFAKKLRAHDPHACAELSKWTKAGGKELPGLVKRRAAERAICEGRGAT